jgi:hypothetical protein
MSYDIEILDNNGQVMKLKNKHQIKGGTYCIGGMCEAWINITYNYHKFYKALWGEDGIKSLNGVNSGDCIPMLEKAVKKLGLKKENNYWKATKGNAGGALNRLLHLCKLFPSGTLSIM